MVRPKNIRPRPIIGLTNPNSQTGNLMSHHCIPILRGMKLRIIVPSGHCRLRQAAVVGRQHS